MSQPFESPHEDPHHEGFGFGLFDQHSRRAVHHARREARREMGDLLKDQAFARSGGPFGPGFGPGGPRGGRRGRGRGRRGDVRSAILALLTERPMHGYEMIQEIAQRSNGLWRPSPGSVYPTLQLLVDEGLIVGTETEGSKRLFELTDDGREAAAKTQTPPNAPPRTRSTCALPSPSSPPRCSRQRMPPHPNSRNASSTSSTTRDARSTAC